MPNATTNATTAAESHSESDERLLKLIQAWPRLTAARQRMIGLEIAIRPPSIVVELRVHLNVPTNGNTIVPRR